MSMNNQKTKRLHHAEARLKPCPLCGAGQTIMEKYPEKYGSGGFVDLRHWCEKQGVEEADCFFFLRGDNADRVIQKYNNRVENSRRSSKKRVVQ